MDWHKIAHSKHLKKTLIGSGIVGICGVFFVLVKPVVLEFRDSFAWKEFKKFGLIETYRRHYEYFFHEVDRLVTADQREESLVRNLASTQKLLEVERAKNAEFEIGKEVKSITGNLKTKAGSIFARIPEGIEYEAPKGMLPHQLLVLAMEYYRNQHFEKAAVIFHTLLNHPNDKSYQTPEYFLISGICWYKIHYFEMAIHHMKLSQKAGNQKNEIFRQALVWQAIVEKSKGDRKASQKTLSQLITLFPQSEEAAWVNGNRKPASVKKAEKPVKLEHAHAEHADAEHPHTDAPSSKEKHSVEHQSDHQESSHE